MQFICDLDNPVPNSYTDVEQVTDVTGTKDTENKLACLNSFL